MEAPTQHPGVPQVSIWCGDVAPDKDGHPMMVQVPASSIEHLLMSATKLLKLPYEASTVHWAHTGEVVRDVGWLSEGDELMVTLSTVPAQPLDSEEADVAAEWTAQVFNEADVDGNGVIDHEEWASMESPLLTQNCQDDAEECDHVAGMDLDFRIRIGVPGAVHFYHTRVALRPNGRFAIKEQRACDVDSSVVYEGRWDGFYRLQVDPAEGDCLVTFSGFEEDCHLGVSGPSSRAQHPFKFVGLLAADGQSLVLYRQAAGEAERLVPFSSLNVPLNTERPQSTRRRSRLQNRAGGAKEAACEVRLAFIDNSTHRTVTRVKGIIEDGQDTKNAWSTNTGLTAVKLNPGNYTLITDPIFATIGGRMFMRYHPKRQSFVVDRDSRKVHFHS